MTHFRSDPREPRHEPRYGATKAELTGDITNRAGALILEAEMEYSGKILNGPYKGKYLSFWRSWFTVSRPRNGERFYDMTNPEFQTGRYRWLYSWRAWAFEGWDH